MVLVWGNGIGWNRIRMEEIGNNSHLESVTVLSQEIICFIRGSKFSPVTAPSQSNGKKQGSLFLPVGFEITLTCDLAFDSCTRRKILNHKRGSID